MESKRMARRNPAKGPRKVSRTPASRGNLAETSKRTRVSRTKNKARGNKDNAMADPMRRLGKQENLASNRAKTERETKRVSGQSRMRNRGQVSPRPGLAISAANNRAQANGRKNNQARSRTGRRK